MIWLWRLFLIIGCPILAIGLGTLFGRATASKTTQSPTLTERHRNTITFDKFLEFYNVNPNKWITFDLPSFEYDVEYMLDNKNVTLYWETEEDKKRYHRWIIDQTVQELNKKDTEEYQLILEDIQKDVREKMDAIQKEREAKLLQVEEERKKNQKEYERLMNEVVNLAHSVTIPVDKAINNFSQIDYTTALNNATNITTPNKIYIHKDSLPIIKENNNIVKLWDNSFGYYFEADCGIPYIKTIDGKILEVKIFK